MKNNVGKALLLSIFGSVYLLHGMQSHDVATLTQLVESGDTSAYEQAIAAAVKALQSDHMMVRWSGSKIFKALVDKGQGYTQAIEAAEKAAQSNNSDVRPLGLQLFEALVDKGQGYAEAIVAAQAVQSDNIWERSSGLNLYRALVDKGQTQIYKQAIAVAAQAVQSDDWFERSSGLDLYRALVDKGQTQIYKQAIAAAEKAAQSDHMMVRWSGLDLYRALVLKKKAFEEVSALIKQWNVNDKNSLLAKYLGLLKSFVFEFDTLDDTTRAKILQDVTHALKQEKLGDYTISSYLILNIWDIRNRSDSRNRQQAYKDALAYVVNLSNPMTPAIAEFIKWHPIPDPWTSKLRVIQAMEDPATYDAGKMAMIESIRTGQLMALLESIRIGQLNVPLISPPGGMPSSSAAVLPR